MNTKSGAAANQIVPISVAYSRSDGAVEHGVSRDRLFERSFIHQDDQTHLSFAQIGLLYLNTIEETEDQFSGLGRHAVPPAQLALMLRVMMACDTLGCAITALARFHEMASPILLRLRTDAATARVEIRCQDGFADVHAPVVEEVYLNSVFGGLSYFLGRAFPATAMMTRNPRNVALGARHWSMLAPIHFGGSCGLHFPTDLLMENRQGHPADDIFGSVIEHWLAFADRSLRGGSKAVTIRKINTSALCAELGISPATFRRRNVAKGEPFRRYREETLVEASLCLLADDTRSVSSIAAELGYADVRSYRRFIKGATGQTPDQLRINTASAAMRASEPQVLSRIGDIAKRISR